MSAIRGSSTTPSRVPVAVSSRAAAVGVDHDRRRVPAAGDRQPEPAAAQRLQPGEQRGQELARAALVEHRAVEGAEHRRGRFVRVGGRAHGVAGERGQRGGVDALAADVADRDAPRAVAERERVVEVAADLDALGAGLQPSGEVDPGHVGQRARQQRGLQRLRDRVLALVELRAGDRDRGLRGDRGQHARARRCRTRPGG